MGARDPKYLSRVRQLPCCMCGAWPPNQSHHLTGGGMALKTSDGSTIPLCFKDHHDLHALAGRFKGWTKEQLRTWQQTKVMETMELLSQ